MYRNYYPSVILKSIKHYPIHKISLPSGSVDVSTTDDKVVCEEPLEVWVALPQVQPTLLFTTMRTPGDDFNLVKGWLFSSGAINRLEHIHSITHTGVGRLKQQATNRVVVTLTVNIDISVYQRAELMNSACGVCGQQSIENLLEKLPTQSSPAPSSLKLSAQQVIVLTESLVQQQPLFAQTGGNHGAALFDKEAKVIDTREDVGRHNALDKLIGANLASLLEQDKTLVGLVLSGRVSFELVQKCAMADLSYIVALGAPSSLAIDLAKDCDICLIGFVKAKGFNCYAGWDRLL